MWVAPALALPTRRLTATPSGVMKRGQFPNASLSTCWETPSRCHIHQGAFLSFLWFLGSSLSLHFFPIFTAPPKKILSPQASQELSQSDIQQLNQLPRTLPSTLMQGSNTWCSFYLRRPRCWAASKKIGSSADSKIKSSQSMKSALVTLHT